MTNASTEGTKDNGRGSCTDALPAAAGERCPAHQHEDDDCEPDVCVHGRGFDEICVECCPEDDDGSFTGDEWS